MVEVGAAPGGVPVAVSPMKPFAVPFDKYPRQVCVPAPSVLQPVSTLMSAVPLPMTSLPTVRPPVCVTLPAPPPTALMTPALIVIVVPSGFTTPNAPVVACDRPAEDPVGSK